MWCSTATGLPKAGTHYPRAVNTATARGHGPWTRAVCTDRWCQAGQIIGRVCFRVLSSSQRRDGLGATYRAA